MKCPYCEQEHPDETKICPITGKEIQLDQLQPVALPQDETASPAVNTESFQPQAGQPTLEPPIQPVAGIATPPPAETLYAAQSAAINETPAPALQPFAASSAGLKQSRYTGTRFFCCCLPIPLVFVLLIALLVLIDPLQYHLWGRVTGSYDAAAEVMPSSADLYLGFNIGNALLTRVDKKIVVATPASGASLLPARGAGQLAPANPAAEQQISLPTDFITNLEDELGIKVPGDLTPWIGQYGGIAVLDFQDLYGTPAPGGWVVAVESRNNRQADAFLEKISGNLSANKGLVFKRDVYKGINLYVQDVQDTDYAIAFGRSKRMLLFASNLGILRDIIDGQGKPALSADADYQKLIAYRPRTWSASLYISHQVMGDYLDQLLQSSPASSALDSVMPFADNSWTGTLLNATVIPQGLRFDTYTAYDLSSKSENAKQVLQGWNSMPDQVVQRLPQDTLVYMANSNFGQFWKTWFATATQNDPTIANFDAEFEQFLGFSLQKDLLEHITGQWALYAVPSAQGSLSQSADVNLAISLLVQSDSALDVKPIATGLQNSILLEGASLKSHELDGSNFYELTMPGNEYATLAFGAGQGYFTLGTDLQAIQESLSSTGPLVDSLRYRRALVALPKGSTPTLYLDLQNLFANLREGMSGEELKSFNEETSFLDPYEMLAVSTRLVKEDVAHNTIVLILTQK